MADELSDKGTVAPQGGSFVVWVAQGFGIGRVPKAPGTVGTLLGFPLFALLLLPGNYWCFLAGCVAGIFVSERFCTLAERVTGLKDPGSVVIDEIIAIPICFVGLVTSFWMAEGVMPSPAYFFTEKWMLPFVVFGLFRLFDIWKPEPVNSSQNLPKGWGVTLDDVLAAVYVNLVLLPFLV